MPPKKREPSESIPISQQVQVALEWLEKNSAQRDRDNLKRFAISTEKVFGVSMARMRVLGKQLGRNHELAEGLWQAGWYEARMLAAMIDEPAKVTPARWIAGRKTSTTGPSVIRRAFICSIARLTPGIRFARGRSENRSSRSGLRSRCWQASPCTTRRRRTSRLSNVSRSSNMLQPMAGTSSRKQWFGLSAGLPLEIRC
ncbi:MAG: hypothetical protein EXS09_15175 [Gemmataceae bacterium]|nr:hypothetical protein [Gemmataceae bacterium]